MDLVTLLKRTEEIKEAKAIYPGMEIGEAYRRYKEAKGEKAEMLLSGDKEIEQVKKIALTLFKRPCTAEGCHGTQTLSGVCSGCLAAKKGFKTQWECDDCLHRDFSKETYLEVYERLTKKENENAIR